MMKQLKGIIAKILVWLKLFIMVVLKHGSIPRHIAFIMDGNRRYARHHAVPTIAGHSMGFKALERILEWCLDIGVQEVSIYAFSIENFKRPKEEVDGLMDLAADKLAKMMQENQMIDKLGICVRFPGDRTLLPEKVRKVMDDVMEYSKDNTRAILNVCFSYTSRDEITQAVQKIAVTAKSAGEKVHGRRSHHRLTGDESRIVRLLKGEKNIPAPDGVDGLWGEGGEGSEGMRNEDWGWEDEVWHALQVSTSADLMVRTSGEIRLSDYLLWQSAFSTVIFLNVLWPDFSWWHFLYLILTYQYNLRTMQDRRKYYSSNIKNHTYEDEKLPYKGGLSESIQESLQL